MDKLTIISGCLFLAADIFAIASLANPDWINTGESAGERGRWRGPSGEGGQVGAGGGRGARPEAAGGPGRLLLRGRWSSTRGARGCRAGTGEGMNVLGLPAGRGG